MENIKDFLIKYRGAIIGIIIRNTCVIYRAL